MFTNVFYKFYFIFFYFFNEFTYSECILITRVKNPVEHFSDTTLTYKLPKNIYRYEPYRGHRTLWRPTPKHNTVSKQRTPSNSRIKPAVIKQYKQKTAPQHNMKEFSVKSYWHHFDDDEEAWPKVVLVLSSTKRTTTPKKILKTFPSYFPHKNSAKENSEPDAQNNTGDDNISSQDMMMNESYMNWIPLNFELSPTLYEEEEESEDIDENGEITMKIDNKEFITRDTMHQISTVDESTVYSRETTAANNNFEGEEEPVSTNFEDIGFTTTSMEKSIAPEYRESVLLTTQATPETTKVATSEEDPKDTKIIYTYSPTTTTSTETVKAPKETDVEQLSEIVTTSTKPRSQQRRIIFQTKQRALRKPYQPKRLMNSKPVKCYQCGLNTSEIPQGPTCHQVFDSGERTHYHFRVMYKVVCGSMRKNFISRAVVYDPSPQRVYKSGCFKRFLDIGELYNERGCRTMEPLKGKSFASSRLVTLERSIYYMDEGCVTSPHASLTPFSRGISLYARYHVCVCKGNYCNSATILTLKTIPLLLLNTFLRI